MYYLYLRIFVIKHIFRNFAAVLKENRFKYKGYNLQLKYI